MYTGSEKLAIDKPIQIAKKMNTPAHHFDHADRVRKYARKISESENLNKRDIFLVEIAAVWHDIGLDYVENRGDHPEKSSDMFLETFKGSDSFTSEEKQTIHFLIKYHDKYSEAIKHTEDSNLLLMLRILIDADTLELLGEQGYKRAKETANSCGWPKFGSNKPKGDTFGFSSKDFDKRFAQKRKGLIEHAIEPTLIGQLNFQISCADLLYTKHAKKLSKEMTKIIKEKLLAGLEPI